MKLPTILLLVGTALAIIPNSQERNSDVKNVFEKRYVGYDSKNPK
ncbi:hypothetical protein Vi05172_g10744 [Venturia inaequalis]|nr:hypothetical protein Vi05172_g10744 [Venturia inaequalis]